MSWFPPHAYIPGKTARHPEGNFDEFKLSLNSKKYKCFHETETWKMAFIFLDKSYYWEAHELFEAIWFLCPPNSPEKLFVQALIQLANAGLKQKMGADGAVKKLTLESNRLAKEAFNRSNGKIFGYSENVWSEILVKQT